uniref:Acetylglutamate kinase n=1 Tax=Membranoptera platyphylla TaxID=1204437 RepID=A0A1I9KQK0_9FLOR|nr:acetylglutamate kinase [Membranoptera platyphylla]AMJ16895.1 acetylglutamate kinase [Membranoptera platyphylla]
MSNNLKDDRFSLLIEILPLIKQYAGCTFVIKYGGSAMESILLQSAVIKDICFLYSMGIKIILVHGGGPFINHWLTKLDMKTMFKDGVRITDSKTMEIVEMVLVGKVNKQLVSLFNQNRVSSIGLSGKDANLISSSPLFKSSDNLVGKIDTINIEILQLLLNNNYIPIIASVGMGINNQTHNINADTAAGCIAQSLKADKLILLTDTQGILLDINDSSSLIKKLNLGDIDQLRKKSIISGGMIPKVDCCIAALKSNVNSAHIIDGRIQHALLYEIFTKDRIGSMITL